MIFGMDVELVGKEGNVLVAPDGDAPGSVLLPPELPSAHARHGETRRECWERLRLEARAAGMGKKDAYQYATIQVDRVWPAPLPPEPDPPPAEIATPEPDPPAPIEPDPLPPDPPAALEPPAPVVSVVASTGGVAGLGDLPEDWPVLPANASLAAEIAWTQANRLRVVQGGAVDLSRSLGPAPSYAALSWLETSILYPAKFADVCVKASGDTQDDAEGVRREKVSIDELRTLLSEARAAT